ncbi:MAG: PAS domain-containing protein [Candidatus Margulisiibacteriota bacterium]|jgi:PAS domain S-box-containing protein
MRLRGKAEWSQLKAERYFQDLFEKSTTPSLIFKDGHFINANPTALKMLGLESLNELLNKNPVDISPEKQPDGQLSKEKNILEINQATTKGSTRFEWIHLRRDGSTFPVEVNLTSIGTPDGKLIYGTWTDISERKNREAELKKSEEAYRTLAENLPGLVFRCHLEKGHAMQLFNNMLAPLTGYTEQELMKDGLCTIEPIIHPDDKQMVMDTLKESVYYNKPFRIEYRIIHKTGQVKYLSHRGRPVYDDLGKALYIDGVFFDVTDSKQADQRLAENEARFKTLFEVSPNPIFIESLDGKIIDCNAAAAKLFGYTKDEMLRLNTAALVPPQVAASFPDLVKMVLEKGEFFTEAQNKKKSGELFPAEVWIKAIEVNGQKMVLVAVQDVTGRKLTEGKMKEELEMLSLISNTAAGRELKMIEMEKEVNALLKELGKEAKYK